MVKTKCIALALLTGLNSKALISRYTPSLVIGLGMERKHECIVVLKVLDCNQKKWNQ